MPGKTEKKSRRHVGSGTTIFFSDASAAFTLIELLVVIAIIAILAAMLMPALQSARDQARMIACMSQLRQFGTSIHLYANDFNSEVPQGYGSVYNPARAWDAWQNYYARVCDNRCGVWMAYVGRPAGIRHLWNAGYVETPWLYYCPSFNQKQWGGHDHSSRGWNDADTGYIISSYYYRYAFGAPSVGTIYDRDPSVDDGAGR
ncbi:MAG: type II secretion system protein [Candidatus Brocadiia bacterium]